MIRRAFSGNCLVAAVVIALSFFNAARSLRPYLHRPLFKQTDPISVRQRELIHANLVVHKLGAGRLAYFDEEPGWKTIEAVGEYYAVQYALAPAILRRDSAEDQFALVNFRLSRKPTPISGYVFVEDLGAGLALYRKL